MKRRADRPLQKVTLNLFAGDWDKLSVFYEKMGPSRAVRDLVRAHVHKLETATGPRPIMDLDIEPLMEKEDD